MITACFIHPKMERVTGRGKGEEGWTFTIFSTLARGG
jgi:hypothetical protein